MIYKLTDLEEFDLRTKLQMPHLCYRPLNMNAKKKIAYQVLRSPESDILMINASGFKSPAVIAGLTEKSIEYIAKKAPLDYKTNIIKLVRDSFEMDELHKIAEEMDRDLGLNRTDNRERVKNVIQYIMDNQKVFLFG